MCVTKNLTKNPWGGVFVCEALICQTVNRRDIMPPQYVGGVFARARG